MDKNTDQEPLISTSAVKNLGKKKHLRGPIEGSHAACLGHSKFAPCFC